MNKKPQIKRPFRRKKTGADCPQCGAEMLIIATKAERHVDPVAGETLVTRYVRCANCQSKAVNTSHTKIIK